MSRKKKLDPEGQAKKEKKQKHALRTEILHRGTLHFYCTKEEKCLPNAYCEICRAQYSIHKDMVKMWGAINIHIRKGAGHVSARVSPYIPDDVSRFVQSQIKEQEGSGQMGTESNPGGGE